MHRSINYKIDMKGRPGEKKKNIFIKCHRNTFILDNEKEMKISSLSRKSIEMMCLPTSTTF